MKAIHEMLTRTINAIVIAAAHLAICAMYRIPGSKADTTPCQAKPNHGH